MARTTQEIYNALVAKREEHIPVMSSSETAEWRTWLWIFAYGIYLFELILDIFKSDVESKLQFKQPGSTLWYIEKAKEFQLGDSMQVSDKGIVSYPVVDTAKQIIKQASVSEADGTLYLKVAKFDEDGNLSPLDLTNGEFLQFQRYIERAKFAGTKITVTTLAADVIAYDVTVYYDPAWLPDTVSQAVSDRLDAFRLELGFDGLFFTSDFIKAILEVEGVKTVKVNSLTGTQGESTEAIDVSYNVQAGYFNFDENSVLAMQNVNQ
ncbi:MAG: hypothetical protein RBU23_13015 [Candidatus Auribacterota bacterium]|jgi:hypothetical protein|nr:hypothetical protein [Candidatus Auribacterota bacterium]